MQGGTYGRGMEISKASQSKEMSTGMIMIDLVNQSIDDFWAVTQNVGDNCDINDDHDDDDGNDCDDDNDEDDNDNDDDDGYNDNNDDKDDKETNDKDDDR